MAKTFTIRIGDKIHKAVTVSGLAEIMGLSPHTIRKYEARKILPPANYRLPSKNTAFTQVGRRVYLLATAEKLRDLFKEKVRQGVPMSEEVKVEIKQIFAKELNAT